MHRRVSLRSSLLCGTLLATVLAMQPACQSQKQKTKDPATKSIAKKPAAPPSNPKLDEASRANMGSKETEFVQQAEKMIGASKEYLQNTTDPTGALAGAAGEIAQKDPEELGAGMAAPELEIALESAETATEWISDKDVPEELVDGSMDKMGNSSADRKKAKQAMTAGAVLLGLGFLGMAGGCFVKSPEKGKGIASLFGNPELGTARKGMIAAGAFAFASGTVATIWGAITYKKKTGAGLAAGTYDIHDPAKMRYLKALHTIVQEVRFLQSERGFEGLQLAGTCRGAADGGGIARSKSESETSRMTQAEAEAELRSAQEELTQAQQQVYQQELVHQQPASISAVDEAERELWEANLHLAQLKEGAQEKVTKAKEKVTEAEEKVTKAKEKVTEAEQTKWQQVQKEKKATLAKRTEAETRVKEAQRTLDELPESE